MANAIVSIRRTSLKTVSIYCLTDPETGSVRYVGKTVAGLQKRLKNHLSEALRKTKKHRSANWLRSLISKKLIPDIFEIESVPQGHDWVEAEMHWIAVMRSYGFDLTNSANGGQGTDGYKFSACQIEKLKASHLGIKKSKLAIAKYQEAMRRKKESGWVKPKRTPAEIALQFETRKKNKDAGLHKPRRKATEEEKLQFSIARIACDSPEMRLKISQGRRAGIAARKAMLVSVNCQIPIDF